MRITPGILAIVLLGPMAAGAAVPRRVGTCDLTSIAAMEHRLQTGPGSTSMPGSGTAIEFADGLYVVSYQEEPIVAEWRHGDPVMICLAGIPRHCPPGDARGRGYTVTNLKTMQSITLPDAEHSCGGA